MTTPSHAPIRSRAGRMAILPLAALAVSAGVWAGAAGLAGPAGASSSPKVVKTTETDFHIALSKSTFSPGKYTFVAVNKGAVTHSLEITGPGLSNAKAKNIAPGQTTKLTVTLKKGAYDIFCPVPGHKMLGMNVNITVGSHSGSGASTASKTSTTSTTSGSGGYGY
jgi:uncharacterized cupredoxin-like copper-binding protein